jgi:hypothetical protein
MADSSQFKPEDYSRFLIREFLKKNGFDKTYDQFLLEDSRKKVTMTKNELTRLLGIDSLMKRNSKTKAFETMLDILCDFLMIQREVSGGVEIPVDGNSSIRNTGINSTAISESSVNNTANKSHAKKASSSVRQP